MCGNRGINRHRFNEAVLASTNMQFECGQWRREQLHHIVVACFYIILQWHSSYLSCLESCGTFWIYIKPSFICNVMAWQKNRRGLYLAIPAYQKIPQQKNNGRIPYLKGGYGVTSMPGTVLIKKRSCPQDRLHGHHSLVPCSTLAVLYQLL